MKRFAVLALFTLCASLAFGQLAEASSGWLAAFGSLADPNVGLTAFPILLVPAGGRLEGMGTAGTATSEDLSAFEANPAAAASRERTELGLFHHAWYADGALDTVSFTLGRGSLGIVAGAKVLYLPFTAYDDVGTPVASGYYTEIMAAAGGALRIVNAPAFSLSLGATLKVAVRAFPKAVLAGQSALGFPMDVGLLADLSFLDFGRGARRKNFSVGVSLRNFGQGDLGAPLPTVLAAGVSYSPVRPLTTAFDVNVPVSFDPERAPAEHLLVAGGASLAVTHFL